MQLTRPGYHICTCPLIGTVSIICSSCRPCPNLCHCLACLHCCGQGSLCSSAGLTDTQPCLSWPPCTCLAHIGGGGGGASAAQKCLLCMGMRVSEHEKEEVSLQGGSPVLCSPITTQCPFANMSFAKASMSSTLQAVSCTIHRNLSPSAKQVRCPTCNTLCPGTWDQLRAPFACTYACCCWMTLCSRSCVRLYQLAGALVRGYMWVHICMLLLGDSVQMRKCKTLKFSRSAGELYQLPEEAQVATPQV